MSELKQRIRWTKNPLHHLFNPCRHEVEVFMGYGGDLTTDAQGKFHDDGTKLSRAVVARRSRCAV